MERLVDNIYSFKDKVEECENAYLLAVQKKLKEYEDLEEQGRLIKLSCKVGDTVYYINPDKNTINELVVYGFDIRPLQRFVYDYMGARLNFNQFGKTVFLTESEAETKLEELRGEAK
jgi:hypothetical protein